jgi:diguanylate cyclase
MEFYSIGEYAISILMGCIGAFIGMTLIKRLKPVDNEFHIHWSSYLFGAVIVLAYLYGGLSEIQVNLNLMAHVLLFVVATLSVHYTINTIRVMEISFLRLIGGATVFGLCITLVNMIDFINELVENQLKINLFLFISGIILAIGSSIATIRFIRQLRSVENVNIYWFIFGSSAIGMAFASLRFTMFSSVTLFSNIDLFNNNNISVFEWAYIDNSLLPMTVNILGLVILELVPGLFGDERNKKQAEQIVENKQRYTSLFENKAVAIIALNQSGIIIAANKAAFLITKWESEQVINKMKFVSWIKKSKRGEFHSYLNEAYEGSSQMLETIIQINEKSHMHAQITLVPIFVKNKLKSVNVLVKDITETIEAREQIQFLAYRDPLTSLPNRRYFMNKLAKHTIKNEHKLALFFLDVDRFKVINDVLGHTIGDELLVQLSDRLNHLISNNENITIARMGGDEFTILYSSFEDINEVEKLAENIISQINIPFNVNDQELYITGSLGIALFPEDGTNQEELMQFADTAMYRAKEKGKNTFEFYHSNSNYVIGERLTLEKDLRKALAKGEFELYYQPQMNVKSGDTGSVEALIRWNHPKKGIVAPGKFIPLAEDIGIIHKIGEWVLLEACTQVKQWHDEGNKIKLSVNVSLKQFYNKHFVSTVYEVLQETKFPPSFLDIEITESMAMKDVEQAVFIFEQLRDLGISISLDDFGKGYSSLNHIKELPINRLKIDGSFIRDIPNNEEAIIIIKTIIAMASTLNLVSVAEHVENEEQLNFLKTLNCDEIQGYFYTPPMPAEKTESWFKEQTLNSK